MTRRPGTPRQSNYRMLGVADLMDAVAQDREPRCSGRLAAHIVEVMEAVLQSAADRTFVRIRSKVDRPAPLTAAVDNFYTTDAISRASATLAECSEIFVTGKLEKTGTDA